MKHLLYLTLSVLVMSCCTEPKNNGATQIGYEILESGEKVSLNAGDCQLLKFGKNI